MAKAIVESGNPDSRVEMFDHPDVPVGREAAPDVEAFDFGSFLQNERNDIIRRLDEDNPDFKHSYAKPGATPEQLARKGQTLVDGERHFDDPVVRQDRTQYEKRRENEAAFSAYSVESIVDPENDIYLQSNPKRPIRKRFQRS